MLCVSSFQSQSDSQKSSNSQSAQSTFPTFVGDFSSGRSDGPPPPQGSSNKLMNQNHLGAKRALSEPYSSQKASSRYSAIENSADMQQTSVHKMESTPRYSNNNGGDMPSSHNGPGGFMNGSGSFHNSESGRVHNPNSYGAQYSSQAEKVKSQNYGCENNGASDSPYSGWQGLPTSVSSSSSSNNGWNIPDASSTIGRSIHANHESLANAHDENMVVDNDATFPGLLGATGGADNYSDEKSNGSNNFLSNSRSMHMPRLGLLGGGENSLSQSSGWNGNQGPTSSVAGWGNRQNNGVSDGTVNPNSENMVVDGDMGYAGLIGATGGTDGKQNPGSNTYRQEPTIPPPRTGLLGGGDGNLNGWGNPNNSGSSTPGWTTNARSSSASAVSDISGASGSATSPTKPQASWAQAAGKGLNPALTPCGGANGQGAATSLESSCEIPQESTAKERAEEQAKELRLKAAFSEGWGQNNVNQDTSWDVPSSPPPEPGKENSAMWRAPVNNGTEIWENNLRMNKGTTVPVPTTTAPPWGHTPASNIGGHWGDDDSSNNMWNGVPPNANNPSAGNWPDSNPNQANSNTWGGSNPNDRQWTGNQQAGASWNDGSGGSDNGTSAWNAAANKGRNWSPMTTPKKDLPTPGWDPSSPTTNRRPPSTNYDDGTGVWGNPQRQGKVSHWKDMPSAKPIMNTGNNMVGPNGMPPANLGGMSMSGPGMIRFPTGSSNQKLDMQVEMWSNKKPPPTGRMNWQDMPPHRESNTWGDDSHSQHNQMKQMGGSNQQGVPYNGGWNEQANNSLSYWGAKPKSNANWADGQVDTSSWLGPAKQGGKPLCRDLIWASKQFRLLIELGYKKDEVENALRNNNMQFDDALGELRTGGVSMESNMMDVDNYGGRKVRPANANDEMSMSEHNLESAFVQNSYHGQSAFQPMNYPGVQPYKQQVNKCSAPNTGNANILNALGGQQSTIGSIGSLSPALVHKLLQQQQQTVQQPFTPQNMQQNFNNQSGRVSQNSSFPSTAQLRHLVQQIQMAVQAGHLNPQILNQPLAPQTLQLLYQLLQQIKVLSQLQQQQVYQSQHLGKAVPGGQNNTGLQLNVQVTQTKQRIVNLQNQIAAQQAVFLKQQAPAVPQAQQQQPITVPPPSSSDAFKPNMESMPALHSEFRDLSIKEAPPQNHQSRLNQWKLPAYEKDENPMCSTADSNPNIGNMSGSNSNSFGNEFSRAPGPQHNKPPPGTSSSMPNTGPSLHPLLSQGDSAWSSLSRPHTDSGWPEPIAASSAGDSNGPTSGNSTATSMMCSGQSAETKESSAVPTTSGSSTSSASHSSYNLTDLVPEFEPGKPWKGNQMKSIEDDPHITPGSIARSPLSVNTIKDTNLFWNSKNSPSNSTSDTSLASSTWGFSGQNSSANSSSNQMKATNSKSNWGPMSSSELVSGSELWGSSSSSKSRGPPPGLASQGWDHQASATFLILRNLTPQIDGSTLKTLCMQHGPLQMFHLSLNRGVALVRYSTREEASKAQSALNNCVLGNTTMLADIPSEGEIAQHFQVSSGSAAGNNNNSWSSSQQGSSGSSSNFPSASSNSYFGGTAFPGGNSGMAKEAPNWNGHLPGSQLWSYNSSNNNSLWGSSQPVNDHDQSTNPINSYLPGDLLGGDPM